MCERGSRHLTKSSLVSSVLTVALAVAVPAGGHALVEASAAAELGWHARLVLCTTQRGEKT